MISVPASANTYIPFPKHMPKADTAHIPAEVVSPFMVLFFSTIMPAPRKQMPVTILAAIRDASTCTPWYITTSKYEYLEQMEKIALANAAMIWVRIPATFSLFFLSYPITAPAKQASINRTTSST